LLFYGRRHEEQQKMQRSVEAPFSFSTLSLSAQVAFFSNGTKHAAIGHRVSRPERLRVGFIEVPSSTLNRQSALFHALSESTARIGVRIVRRGVGAWDFQMYRLPRSPVSQSASPPALFPRLLVSELPFVGAGAPVQAHRRAKNKASKQGRVVFRKWWTRARVCLPARGAKRSEQRCFFFCVRDAAAAARERLKRSRRRRQFDSAAEARLRRCGPTRQAGGRRRPTDDAAGRRRPTVLYTSYVVIGKRGVVTKRQYAAPVHSIQINHPL